MLLQAKHMHTRKSISLKIIKVVVLIENSGLSVSFSACDNIYFLTFPACFSIPIIFSNLNFNCSNLSSLRNLQEQVKKAFCYQELFWPFTA